MVAGDHCELTIQRLVAGGDGLGFLDGLAVFVPLSAPGDVLTVSIKEVRKDYAKAELVHLLEPSPDRVDPICPLYGVCGGCNLMHLSYKAQTVARLDIFHEAFRRAGINADCREPLASSFGANPGANSSLGAGQNRCLPLDTALITSEPFGYRNRAQFHFGSDGLPGYARRNSNALIPVRDCPILVSSLRNWLGEQGRLAGSSAGHTDSLLNARSATPGRGSGQKPADDRRLVAFGTQNRVWLEGRDTEIQVEVGGKTFVFNIKGFFQSNLRMLEHLVSTVCDGRSGTKAADLYAGIGLFGAFLKEIGRASCRERV